ncbi:AraC family transcriptional regulator ligand-binding domain-containing protein [Nocardia sp. NPDC051030]|uniref:AraC family transcriptional regulator ligand-binding domain-containing protein n=1 Tax=Nocardia sp. NPDC051030 TaxID=3155162 RepID=UPI00341558F9
MAVDLARIQGTVSHSLARLVRAAAVDAGASAAELLRVPVSDTADPLARPPTTALIRLWESMTVRLSDDAPGLAVAERAGFGTLDIWDYLFTSGATLAEGARAAAEYLPLLVDPLARMDVVDSGGQLAIHYSAETRWTEQAAPIHQFLLALILRRAREATGRSLTPVHVGFAHDAPPDHRSLAEAFGTGRIDFGLPRNSLTFLTRDTVTVPLRDPALTQILCRSAGLTIAAAYRQPEQPWLNEFHAALADAFAEGTPSLRDVAARLAISPRTVQRRLDEADASWREELERARRDLAAEIPAPGFSRRALASRLGYADDRSVRRALRRWNQHLPDER